MPPPAGGVQGLVLAQEGVNMESFIEKTKETYPEIFLHDRKFFNWDLKDIQFVILPFDSNNPQSLQDLNSFVAKDADGIEKWEKQLKDGNWIEKDAKLPPKVLIDISVDVIGVRPTALIQDSNIKY